MVQIFKIIRQDFFRIGHSLYLAQGLFKISLVPKSDEHRLQRVKVSQILFKRLNVKDPNTSRYKKVEVGTHKYTYRYIN
jgi:hypothetical protein